MNSPSYPSTVKNLIRHCTHKTWSFRTNPKTFLLTIWMHNRIQWTRIVLQLHWKRGIKFSKRLKIITFRHIFTSSWFIRNRVSAQPQAFCYFHFWYKGRKQLSRFLPITSAMLHNSLSPSYPTSPSCPVFPYMGPSRTSRTHRQHPETGSLKPMYLNRTRIHFTQLREDCESALTGPHKALDKAPWVRFSQSVWNMFFSSLVKIGGPKKSTWCMSTRCTPLATPLPWPDLTLTWGQILTLTFWGQHGYISIRLDERNAMNVKSLR